jgi:hypothetical protein
MFRQKRYNRGAIEREGNALRITIPAQGTLSDAIIPGIVFLGMVVGSLFGFMPLNLPRLIVMLALDAWAFLIFRGIYERIAADQLVTVGNGKITWVLQTALWTRKHELNIADVTEVSASKGWDGFGDLRVTSRGRRRTILANLLSEDAARFANELKRTLDLP